MMKGLVRGSYLISKITLLFFTGFGKVREMKATFGSILAAVSLLFCIIFYF